MRSSSSARSPGSSPPPRFCSCETRADSTSLRTSPTTCRIIRPRTPHPHPPAARPHLGHQGIHGDGIVRGDRDAQPFDFPPGEARIYNNSACFLLGLIIERGSGMPYEDYVAQLFARLGMTRSGYCSNSRIVHGRARGYHRTEAGFERAAYLDHTWPYAAGSLCSTAGDLVTWLRALHRCAADRQRWRPLRAEASAGLSASSVRGRCEAVGLHASVGRRSSCASTASRRSGASRRRAQISCLIDEELSWPPRGPCRRPATTPGRRPPRTPAHSPRRKPTLSRSVLLPAA
jgi:hypothetical protein